MADVDRDWKPAGRSPAQDYDCIGVKGVKLLLLLLLVLLILMVITFSFSNYNTYNIAISH